MAKKSCKKGYYYCNTDKKCKKIPKGWHIMSSTGYLMRDSEHKDDNKDDTEGKKNNGNGNGSNGNGNGNGGSNGGSDGGGVSESKDHEVAMAQSQLKKSERNIKKLRKALGKKEKDIPAWMQAKITDTAHDTDAAAGYADKMDEEVIAEKRDGKSAKSKGYSLRDWFKGGGWVQAGGKYDGKPCAKQPGQKTKPFCRDADDRANMSKKERSRRAAKKRKEDPNANRTGKANMVSASYSNWKQDLNQLDEIAPAIAAGAALGIGAGGMYMINKLRQQKKKSDQGQGDGGLVDRLNKRKQMLQQLGNSYQPEGELVAERDAWGTGPRDFIKMGGKGGLKNDQMLEQERLERLEKLKPGVKLDKAHYEPEGEMVDEGKKDACYHKVKSRYSVWPSAYASGALVKCRKKGAKNWGNKTKKESYEISNWRDDFQALEYESVDIIKAEPLQATQGIGSDMLDEKKALTNKLNKISSQLRKASAMHANQSKEVTKVSKSLEEAKKCWKGYKKTGTQKLFGKTYNRCEKIKEDWQKSNRKDGVDGMSQKSVNAYKRENPGSKLQTAVTGKNPKGKDKKRRSSYCSRSKGQMKMHNIDCSKTPDKKICKARKRWRC